MKMKSTAIITILMAFFFEPSCHAASSLEAKAALYKLLMVLPSLYWYASDACMRETAGNSGQIQTHDEFVRENQAKLEQFEEEKSGGKIVFKARVRLFDLNQPREHWIFEFINDGSSWKPLTAYKYFG